MPKLTLNKVSADFQAWRSTKKFRAEPIPPHLKNMLLKIIPICSQKQILGTLKLTRSTLNAIQKDQNIPDQLVKMIPVELINTDVQEQQNLDFSTCIIAKAEATLTITTANTTAIIRAFICSN